MKVIVNVARRAPSARQPWNWPRVGQKYYYPPHSQDFASCSTNIASFEGSLIFLAFTTRSLLPGRPAQHLGMALTCTGEQVMVGFFLRFGDPDNT